MPCKVLSLIKIINFIIIQCLKKKPLTAALSIANIENKKKEEKKEEEEEASSWGFLAVREVFVTISKHNS